MNTIMNGNLVRFIDADPTMTHLENMIQMANQVTYKDFLIGGFETDREYYIDERSHRNERGIYVVKPIAENERFFWYICPFCQKIHIESKRLLVKDKPVLMANCFCRYMIHQYIQLDCNTDPLALVEDVADSEMQADWDYMNAFTASLVSTAGRW